MDRLGNVSGADRRGGAAASGVKRGARPATIWSKKPGDAASGVARRRLGLRAGPGCRKALTPGHHHRDDGGWAKFDPVRRRGDPIPSESREFKRVKLTLLRP